MEAIWRFVTENQQTLGWLGGGVVVVAGGIWTVAKFFLSRESPSLGASPAAWSPGGTSAAARSRSPTRRSRTKDRTLDPALDRAHPGKA